MAQSLLFSDNKMLKALVFFSLVGLAVAREVSQCSTKFQYTQEDLMTMHPDSALPESMSCMLKCVYEEKGSINSDGVINIDRILEQVQKTKNLTDKTRTVIRECLKDLGPIKTCADVNPTYQCVKNALLAQKKEASKED